MLALLRRAVELGVNFIDTADLWRKRSLPKPCISTHRV